MRIIKNNYKECLPEFEITCGNCDSEIGYGEYDIQHGMDGDYIICPCCGQQIWLDDDESTPETIDFPSDFYQFTTKRSDEEINDWIKESIEHLKKDGDIGWIEGDALVFAIKDFEDDNYARVFVCKNYAESSVKIS